MPRLTRMSKIQKSFMINYLEQQKFLLQQNKLKPSDLEKFNSGWKQFAVELNNLEGAKKNVAQWKDALNEFKVNTRRKARLLNQENTGTGGGPKTLKPLSDVEEKLMALLSKIVIVGASDIPEAGIDADQAVAKHIDENIMEGGLMFGHNPPTEKEEERTFTPRVSVPTPASTEPSTSSSKIQNTSTPNCRKRAASVRNLELNSIAKQHEKCLIMLANSNNNLANAINKKRRKRISAVFNLKF